MLLLRHMKPRVYGSVLDMGTGTGILAITAASNSRVSRVVATDIDPETLSEAQKRAEGAGVSERIEFRIGNLFEGMKSDRFDWILFNPPYLPSEGSIDEASWSGGETGDEVIMNFLSSAVEHLNPGGAILMVYSSETKLNLKELGDVYCYEVLEELSLFFERLYCLLLRPINLSLGPSRTRPQMRPRRARGL